MTASYRTLAGPVEAELRDRGSRFLARAVPVADRAAAAAFLAEQARLHRDATHVVPAFRLHDGTAFASDAGEPAGSAGAPLLTAIEGAGLHGMAAVVVRWYGGTKLGVGGLVRAYGGALADALREAPTRLAVPARRVAVRYPYERTSAVLRVLQAHGAQDVAFAYEGEGAAVEAVVPAAVLRALEEGLRDATQGTVHPEELGDAVLLL